VSGRRRPRLAVVTAVVAAGLVVGLAGCGGSTDTAAPAGGTATTTAAPSTTATGRVNPESIKAADIVADDYRTFDMCSLADYPALSIKGSATPGWSDSYGQCVVFIDATAPVEVTIGPFVAAGQGAVPGFTGLAGGVTDVVTHVDFGGCEHDLVFVDQVQLRIGAYPTDDTKPIAACDILRQVADSVITAAANGKGKPYTNLHPKSFRGLDACAAAPAGVFTVTGVAEGPANHRCKWSTPDDTVTVTFADGFGATFDTENGAIAADIAGRASLVQEYSDVYGICVVSTYHLPAAAGYQEQAAVRVVGPDKKPNCAEARRVAEAVWPTLPTL